MTLIAQLPAGRRIQISTLISDRLSCGILALCPVTVSKNHSVAIEIEEISSELAARHAGLTPAEIPGLAEARRLYKSFGVDPSRHRPSSEALLRRVLKGKGLYQINNAVDSCNLASLRFLLPVGMYDLDLVVGDVELRAGTPGEEFPGIRKGMVNLDGRLGLFDEQGPFGSPTSDSARTCVTEATRNILAVIMATADYSPRAMAENLDTFGDLFVRHCQATETFRSVLVGGLPERQD